MSCPDCASEVSDSARFCGACGASLDPPEQPRTRTLHAVAGPGPRSARSTSASSSDSSDYGRFVPGTVVAERYRVLGLLGRGGMGEVYRADDLKLGQQVALKFLPAELVADAGRLARFHGEVRLARQVSHPNVCRVYDLEEVDGHSYLTMEYVDGEDLATLLRRIGHLPKDKAIEISRQLCAGLAAAHERGVLHRDLKPANVMLDGRGRVRITDFGLAEVVGAPEAHGSRAGTPAYMAPEQLAGGGGSIASDIYALGLVLYEVFTGARAGHGRPGESSMPTPPTTLVEGFDPAVERVIMRCLEPDPRERPKSALSVAAALPGGDPLAMALAAGETPSPEMVAAAGEAGGLRPLLVWACLAAIAVGVVCVARVSDRVGFLSLADPPKAATVLVDRAQEIIRRIGYTDRPAGIGYGIGWHRSYTEFVRDHDASVGRWERLAAPQPPALFLWYRQSPRPLYPDNPGSEITAEDPAPILPGMVHVAVTASGDLWQFNAVPPELDSGGPSVGPVDWAPLFELAGLRPEDFSPAEGRWVPPTYADARSAWTGHYRDVPEFEVRVEAASYRGRPVYFQVRWPWNRPLLTEPFEASVGERTADQIILVLILAALVAGVILARRNLSLGRIDRKGAFRLASVIFAASMLGTLCIAAHNRDALAEWGLFQHLCGQALYSGLVVWLYYIALEPHVRRQWPDRIISWTRLLAGRLRDPMVGRDVLVGVMFGVGYALLGAVLDLLPVWLGRPPAIPGTAGVDLLAGPARWIAELMEGFDLAVNQSLVLLFCLLLLRVLLRRQWAATAGLFAIGSVVLSLWAFQDAGPLGIVYGCVVAALLTFALIRFGLLTLAASLFTLAVLTEFPLSSGLTTWYGLSGLFALIVLAVLVTFAARAALAGRSLLEVRLLAE